MRFVSGVKLCDRAVFDVSLEAFVPMNARHCFYQQETYPSGYYTKDNKCNGWTTPTSQ